MRFTDRTLVAQTAARRLDAAAAQQDAGISVDSPGAIAVGSPSRASASTGARSRPTGPRRVPRPLKADAVPRIREPHPGSAPPRRTGAQAGWIAPAPPSARCGGYPIAGRACCRRNAAGNPRIVAISGTARGPACAGRPPEGPEAAPTRRVSRHRTLQRRGSVADGAAAATETASATPRGQLVSACSTTRGPLPRPHPPGTA